MDRKEYRRTRTFRPSAKAVEREIRRLQEQRVLRKRIVLMIAAFSAVMMIGAVIVMFARPMQVQGMSMEPTLRAEDVLFIDCVHSLPERGDVVVSRAQALDGLRLVKRVIGLPGDEISMNPDTGQVLCNGEVLLEPYVKVLSYEPCDISFPVTVPEGHVFVLGDNREVSVDSRSGAVGMVPLDSVIGKVWSSSRMIGNGV